MSNDPLADALAAAVCQVRDHVGLTVEEMATLLDVPAEVLEAAERGGLAGAPARALLASAFEAAVTAQLETVAWYLCAPGDN